MRHLMVVGVLLGALGAHAQNGAPLIDGLGGPVDLGEPHGDVGELDVTVAFPDGLVYYADEPELTVYFN